MPENVFEITQSNFEEKVEKAELPVLVDFWASWCQPCRMLSPIIDELGKDYAGKITVGKINVDEQGPLAAKFGVMSIPTVILFHHGEIAEKFVGVRPKAQIAQMLDKFTV